jgi:photosystem II stability/assembly factor-like uncharacterized protein
MGTYLAVGAWIRFPSAAAKQRWLALRVDSAAFADWPPHIRGPVDDARVEASSVAKLLARLTGPRFAAGRAAVAEGKTTFRIAAAFGEGVGIDVFAPALFAAVRRGADVGAVGDGEAMFAEGTGAGVVGLDGGGRFFAPDEVAITTELPEVREAFREGLALVSLGRLPPVPRAARPREALAPRAPVARSKKKPVWKRLPLGTNADVRALRPAPSGEVWAALSDGRLAHGSATRAWKLVDGVRGTSLYGLAVDAKRVWVGGVKGVLACSEDGGRSFTSRAPADVGEQAFVSVIADGEVVLAATQGARGAIWRSEDGGARWRRTYDGESGLTSLARGPGKRVVGVGFGGLLLASSDLGRTFRVARLPGGAMASRVWIRDGSLWAVAGSRILRAKDDQPSKLADVGPKVDSDAMFSSVTSEGDDVWASAWHGVYRGSVSTPSWELALAREDHFNDVVALGGGRVIAGGDRGVVMLGSR